MTSLWVWSIVIGINFLSEFSQQSVGHNMKIHAILLMQIVNQCRPYKLYRSITIYYLISTISLAHQIVKSQN